ncbi:translocator protein isoform X1 [Petromyzon marinus]|uniref:translocator protein isoform X1 n=2 Tax=Petromyzon marinus TaxID=7757 RepID=UPI003F72A7E6
MLPDATHTRLGLRHGISNHTMVSAAWVPPVCATLLPHVGGIVGGLLTRSEIKGWYEGLKKPAWRPPNRAFPVVWPLLYTGMGYASYLVWRDVGGFTDDAVTPLGLYGAQLALNWMWTPIFFKAHRMGLAFAEILLLCGTAAATAVSWCPINTTAAMLMVPYLAWLSFAAALNYRVWQDNKGPGEGESDKKEG